MVVVRTGMRHRTEGRMMIARLRPEPDAVNSRLVGHGGDGGYPVAHRASDYSMIGRLCYRMADDRCQSVGCPARSSGSAVPALQPGPGPCPGPSGLPWLAGPWGGKRGRGRGREGKEREREREGGTGIRGVRRVEWKQDTRRGPARGRYSSKSWRCMSYQPSCLCLGPLLAIKQPYEYPGKASEKRALRRWSETLSCWAGGRKVTSLLGETRRLRLARG